MPPTAHVTTARRNTTTTATQALLLINGDWTLARAEALAARLERLEPASNDDRGRIILAYRLAFGRVPSLKRSSRPPRSSIARPDLAQSPVLRRTSHRPRGPCRFLPCSPEFQ